MQHSRHDINDPERLRELEASLDDEVSELLTEATDAGYGSGEATAALLRMVKNQPLIASQDPDPPADPVEDSDDNIDRDSNLSPGIALRNTRPISDVLG